MSAVRKMLLPHSPYPPHWHYYHSRSGFISKFVVIITIQSPNPSRAYIYITNFTLTQLDTLGTTKHTCLFKRTLHSPLPSTFPDPQMSVFHVTCNHKIWLNPNPPECHRLIYVIGYLYTIATIPSPYLLLPTLQHHITPSTLHQQYNPFFHLHTTLHLPSLSLQTHLKIPWTLNNQSLDPLQPQHHLYHFPPI